MANPIYLWAYIALVRPQTDLGVFRQGNLLQLLCDIDTVKRSVSGF